MKISSLFRISKKSRELEKSNVPIIETGEDVMGYVRNEIKRILEMTEDDSKPELILREIGTNILKYVSKIYRETGNEGINVSLDALVGIDVVMKELADLVEVHEIHFEDVIHAFSKEEIPNSLISIDMYLFCVDAENRVERLINL